MSSSRFNELPSTVSTVSAAGSQSTAEPKWPFFTTVSKTRTQFKKGTKILIAIGGWGDDEGFEIAARSKERQELWASNVARMVTDTGADGLFPSIHDL
jgi:GH18 family chitinase